MTIDHNEKDSPTGVSSSSETDGNPSHMQSEESTSNQLSGHDDNTAQSPVENVVESEFFLPTDETMVCDELPMEDFFQIDSATEIKNLAGLTILEYEQRRSEKAKLLGIRASVLDGLVMEHQNTSAPNTGGSEMFPDTEPWYEPVDGSLLLYAIVAVIKRHIACEERVAHTAALWIMFSWCIKVMKIAPIACITAPEKRCGKTQLLRIMCSLCLSSLKTDNISTAALFRAIEKWKPSLFIDEADTFLKNNAEMRGVLNAGFEVDGCVIRSVGEDHTPTPFNVFCAKAISGIGHLPDTLKDRSILLELRRKRKDEKCERLRHADPEEFEVIKRKLARWAEDNMEALRIARPESPDELNDRAQDCWEPLLAISDQVGGEWPQIARHAAIAISGAKDDSESENEELLTTIKMLFDVTLANSFSSIDLLKLLSDDVHGPWATCNKGKAMTPRQLASRLGKFNISPKQVRLGSKTLKGYALADFEDAFSRYTSQI